MDPKTYRSLIGRFATGVTVITTDAGGMFHGMTANSVTSVSLDPLLLLVCVDHKSHCLKQLERSSGFGVNVLRHDQADVSAAFATTYAPEAGTLRGVPSARGPAAGLLLLADCLVRFECAIHQRIPAGDHDIVLGRVLSGEWVAEEEGAEPLLYFGGRYRWLRSLG